MKNFLLLFLGLVILGCESKEYSVDFLEPQPSGIGDEQGFNKKYQGVYQGKSSTLSWFAESSKLYISKDKIVSVFSTPTEFAQKDVDSSFTGDRNNDKELKEFLTKSGCTEIKMKKDSIFAIWTHKDTLFSVSEDNVCRYFKESYFLSFRSGYESWKVQRLDLAKGKLSLSMIMPYDSLFHTIPLKEKQAILDDSGEVSNYQIKPSKKELKKLINGEAFREHEVWLKIK